VTVSVSERLDALDQILDHAERHDLFGAAAGIDATAGPSMEELAGVSARARDRLRHGSEHTVVALAGSTGSGKSSLFNALAGDTIATVGARRPTTSQAQALVVGNDDADELLSWLGIQRRHHVASAAAPGLVDGLVLIDLPDHDSVERANRDEVDRLVGLVDMFVWVADPQKYGDESLHVGYLQRLGEHSDVMLFVLSKADLLTDDGVAQCRADFARLVTADGIANPQVVALSTETGAGMDELRDALSTTVAAREAAVLRTEADLRRIGTDLVVASETRSIDHDRHATALVEALTQAVDGDAAAAIVGAHHRHRGRAALDWPVTRWVNKWRRSPARNLPTAANSPTLAPQVSSALRDYADGRTADLPTGWQRAARSQMDAAEPALIEQLGGVASIALRTGSERPRWWALGSALQWFATAVAAVAVVWLLLLFVIETFLQVDIATLTPDVRGVPLPTWLLLGAVVAGIVLTVVLRACVAVAAGRRVRRARAQITDEVRSISERTVIESLNAHRRDADAYRRLTSVLVA